MFPNFLNPLGDHREEGGLFISSAIKSNNSNEIINNQIHSVVAKLGNDKDIFKGAEKKIYIFFP